LKGIGASISTGSKVGADHRERQRERSKVGRCDSDWDHAMQPNDGGGLPQRVSWITGHAVEVAGYPELGIGRPGTGIGWVADELRWLPRASAGI
jgi:hypothetical protein